MSIVPTPCESSRPILVSGLVLLMSLPLSAQERPPIKTGLWQIESRGAPGGAAGPATQLPPELAERLARLGPDARRQFEAMMKAQGAPGGPAGAGAGPGSAAAAAAGGGMKVCYDDETFRKEAWNPVQPGCTHEVVERSAGLWRWRGQCSMPPSTLEGESRFKSATAFSSTVRVTVTQKGRTVTQEFGSEAKWLGADCKGVPPLQKQFPPVR